MESLFGRGIDASRAAVFIQFDDRVHRAVDEAIDLLLPVTKFGFAVQSLHFGRRPRAENAKDRQHPRVLRERPTIDHRHMPEDIAVHVEERHPEVTYEANHCLRPARKEIDEAVGKMDHAALFDHLLAGGAGDVEAVILDEAAVHPEGECVQHLLFGTASRHHRAVDIEALGQVFHQRAEKPLAGLLGRALKNSAQGGVFVQIQKWDGIQPHATAASPGEAIRGKTNPIVQHIIPGAVPRVNGGRRVAAGFS